MSLKRKVEEALGLDDERDEVKKVQPEPTWQGFMKDKYLKLPLTLIIKTRPNLQPKNHHQLDTISMRALKKRETGVGDSEDDDEERGENSPEGDYALHNYIMERDDDMETVLSRHPMHAKMGFISINPRTEIMEYVDCHHDSASGRRIEFKHDMTTPWTITESTAFITKLNFENTLREYTADDEPLLKWLCGHAYREVSFFMAEVKMMMHWWTEYKNLVNKYRTAAVVQDKADLLDFITTLTPK